MVRPVVDHVAALAQAFEIAPPVIARIVIKVRSRQYNPGSPHLYCLFEIGPSSRPTAAITPRMTARIKPTPVGQTADRGSMRSAAPLTNSSGPLEAHAPADLRPVARIKSFHFRLDR